MVGTQKLHELLSKFDLDFNFPSRLMNVIVANGDYDSFVIIPRVLMFVNDTGAKDLKEFNCYHFEDGDSYVEVVPDCNLNTVLSFEKINGRWEGYSFDELGRVSSRS